MLERQRVRWRQLFVLGSNDIVLTGEPRMKECLIGHLVDALRLGGRRSLTWNKKIIRRCVYRAALRRQR